MFNLLISNTQFIFIFIIVQNLRLFNFFLLFFMNLLLLDVADCPKNQFINQLDLSCRLFHIDLYFNTIFPCYYLHQISKNVIQSI
jgi:hypothetical protein